MGVVVVSELPERELEGDSEREWVGACASVRERE